MPVAEPERTPTDEEIQVFLSVRHGTELDDEWPEELSRKIGTGLCHVCVQPVDDHEKANQC